MKPAVLAGFAAGLLLLHALSAQAVDFTLKWWSIDGGGEVLSQSDDQQWQLSGTVGQWDGSEPEAASGSDWTLTGGFWHKVDAIKPEIIFRDGFES
jgi:hypothetical protein